MGEQRNGAENRKIQACGSKTRLAIVGSFWEEPTWAVLEKKVIRWNQLNSKLWVLNSMGQNKSSVFVSQTDIAASYHSLSLGSQESQPPFNCGMMSQELSVLPLFSPAPAFLLLHYLLVHTLSNQPCSISFIYPGPGFIPMWASFQHFSNWVIYLVLTFTTVRNTKALQSSRFL